MALVSLKKRLITLLAEEIKEYLPQFEPYSSDYPMVIYACRDLEEWMKCTWDIKTNHGIHETLGQTLEHEPEVIRVFLTFWVGCWLEKWTERVKILLAKPEIPPNALKRVKEAKKIYRGMKHRNELKKMVIQRLIR
ncbi:MAG: hypothetical protein NWF14_05935, partial [Candidatus Bathyarchaeota archaeon]|nr:hypothetical protein [Candidatus Bathyarchaeota archaeon]